MIVHSAHKPQFVHPYFFAVILATLNCMALIENSVFDYENITFEIWKAHMISLLYFGTLWFSGKSGMYSNEKHRAMFLNRPQQVSPAYRAVPASFPAAPDPPARRMGS